MSFFIGDNMSKKIPTEIYSRCVGYYRPVDQWNKGKQQEFCDRKEAKISDLKKVLSGNTN